MAKNNCNIKWNRYSSAELEYLSAIQKNSQSTDDLINFVREYLINSKFEGGGTLNIYDVKRLLDNTIKKLDLSEEKKSIINFVKNNLESITPQYDCKIVQDSNASFNFEQTDQLIPLLDATTNAYIRTRLENEIFAACVYNDETGYTSPNQIALALKGLKNRLFLILKQDIGEDATNLYSILKDEYNYEQYQLVMNKIWEKYKNENLKNRPLTSTTEHVLQVLEAFYILNNFDDFVSHFGENIIETKQSKSGNMEISDDKYRLFEQHKVSSSYNGDHHDQDSSKQFGKLFRRFWSTIPNGNFGFLSQADFNQLCKFINISINEQNVNWAFLFDPLSTDIDYTESLADSFISALNNDWYLKKRMGYEGEKMISEIIRRLEKCKDYYKTIINRQRTITDEFTLENNVNFIQQLKSEIESNTNNTFVSVNEDGNTEIKSATRITISKEPIITRLQRSLSENLKNKNYAIYNPTILTNLQGSYLYDDKFLQMVREITGLNFSRESLDRFFDSQENQQALFNFIWSFTEDVNTELIPAIREDSKNMDKLIQDFINNLKMKSQPYLDFSSIYISSNRNDTIKILDQNNNTQPLYATPNTSRRFGKNLKDYKKQRELRIGGAIDPKIIEHITRDIVRPIQNIYIKFPKLVQASSYKGKLNANKYIEHIAFRQDVSYTDSDGNKRVLKAVEMNPSEILTVAFNNEFFDSIVSQGTFYNQTECYSDKVTIALAAINVLAELQDDKYKGCIIDLDPKDLKEIWSSQHDDYYRAVRGKILGNLNKVFGTRDIIDLDVLINKLEHTKYDDFKRLVSKYNREHPDDHIEVTEEIDYCKGNNGYCAFNNALYFHIKGIDDKTYINKYLKEGYNTFKDALSSIKIPSKFKNSFYIKQNIEILAKLFGLDISTEPKEKEAISKLEEFFDIKNPDSTKTWVDGSSLSNYLLNKYFILQALVTDAELQISGKRSEIHKGKKVKPLALTKTDSNGNVTSVEIDDIYEHIKEEIQDRLVAGKKRNNAFVASYLPQSVTQKGGVGKTGRIAVVESKKHTFQNYNYQTNDGQDVLDGSCKTLGIAVRWENLSYPGKTVTGVKKTIGLIPTLTSMQQFKLADYPLDNKAIIMSFAQNEEQGQDLRNQAKKMMLPGIFTESFYKAFTNKNRRQFGRSLCKYFGKNVYELTAFEKLNEDPNDHQFTLVWQGADDSSLTPITKTVTINNAYDLWEAFGAEHTIENIDGNWMPSNNSMDMIADIISEYDPIVKTTIISKLADVSCNKSGITNINILDDVNDLNTPLNFTEIDNSRWGLQQDYSHESDESTIPSLTQVLSSIGLNGKNIKFVQRAYEVLSQITLMRANELGIKYNGTKEDEIKFYRKTVKMLVDSLESSSTSISDSVTQIKKAQQILEEAGKDKLTEIPENGKVPFSSPDIFYKLASDFISLLNKKSIRQTYNGIAIIQNPSHSVVGVYEDNRGNTYFSWQIREIGRQDPRVNENTTEAEILQYGLEDPRFNERSFLTEGRPLTLADLDLEDSYRIEIVDNLGNIVKTSKRDVIKSGKINSAEDLFKLEDYLKRALSFWKWATGDEKVSYRIFKTFKGQRNLKGPILKFTENGIKKNFWLTEAVRMRRAAEMSGDTKEILRSLEYYRANLDGLGSENPYYYATYADFIAGKEENKTYVNNVEFQPGEQILPKVNKSAQYLGNTALSDIINQGPSYFYGQADRQIAKTNKLSISSVSESGQLTFNGNLIVTAVRNDDEIVYTDQPFVQNQEQVTTELLGGNNVTLKDGIWYRDDFGHDLFKVPSENSKVYKISSNSKTVYIINDTLENIQGSIVDCLFDLSGVNAVYQEMSSRDLGLSTGALRALNNGIDTDSSIELEKFKQEYAQKLYDSFVLSNYTISARIPSQSFQSFMANKTIGFTLDDLNNGYVNLHEVWFTGSDYDIDKLYTMLYSLDKNGCIATPSPFSIIRSPKLLKESLSLPLPNSNRIIRVDKEDNVSAQLLTICKKYTGTKFTDLKAAYSVINQMRQSNEESKNLKYLQIIHEMLDAVNSTPNPKVRKMSGLIHALNKHNMTKPSVAALKNIIVNTIYECSSDIKNLESSQQPMAAKPFTDLINEVEREAKGRKKVSYNDYDPTTKYRIQYENSVGKKNVGIAANGIKAAAAAQQYFNLYYTNWGKRFVAGDIILLKNNNEVEFLEYLPNNQLQVKVKDNDKPITINSEDVASSYAIHNNTYRFSVKDENGNIKEYGFPISIHQSYKETDENNQEVIRYRDIYTSNEVTFGDVVLDENENIAREKFKRLYLGAEKVNGILNFTEVKALKHLIENGKFLEAEVLTEDGEIINYYWLDDNDGKMKLKSQYRKLQAIWELYKERTGIQTLFEGTEEQQEDAVIDFMFYKRKFNANVADQISILLSLATDNAKELALARINANPQLMSLPIAMLTIGMDPKSVIDVCINVLDPIARKMEGNRLQDNVSTNVRKLILNEDSYDEVTRQSLLRIFDFAQELRTITSFFKVNQGVTAQYIELLDFYQKLANSKRQMEQRKGVKNATVSLDLNKLFAYSNNPEDIEATKQYISNLVADINKSKTGINVIDIVTKNPNFNSMLQAVQIDMNTLKQLAGAARFVNQRSLEDLDSESDSRRFRNLVSIYQDFIIGETLKQLQDFKFKVGDLKVALNTNTLPVDLADEVVFGLNTDIGVNSFMKIMNEVVIPNLKDQYQNNFFMNSLQESVRRQKTVWDIKYDVFNQEDVAEQENILNALNAFSQIGRFSSGLVTTNGGQVSIASALYLYNLIAFKKQMSALDKIVSTFANKEDNKIAQLLTDTYIKFDESRDPIETVYPTLNLVQNAVMNGTFESSAPGQASIDLRDSYIWSFVSPQYARKLVDVIDKRINVEEDLGDKLLLSVDLGDIGILSLPPIKKPLGYTTLDNLQLNPKELQVIVDQINFAINTYTVDGKDVINKKNFDQKWIKSFEPDLKTIFKSIDNVKLLHGININKTSFISNSHGYVVKHNGKKPTIVLDGELFDDQSPITEENQYEILDLMIQSQVDNTVQEKLKYLQNLLDTLKIKDKQKVYKKYCDWLLNNYPEQNVILAAESAFNATQLYRDRKDLYYRIPAKFETDKKNLVLEIGDFVTLDQFGDERFMYIGFVDGSHIFYDLEETKFHKAQDLSECNLQERLRVNLDYSPKKPFVNYSSEWIDSKGIQVKEGDKVKIDLKEYIVYDLLYDPLDSGEYNTLYLALSSRGDFSILRESDIAKAKVLQATSADQQQDKQNKIDIATSFGQSAELLTRLKAGDNIEIKGGRNAKFLRYLSKDNIQVETANGNETIKLSNVQAIYTYSEKLIDKKFLQESKPISIPLKNQSDRYGTFPKMLQASYGLKPVLVKQQGSSVLYFTDNAENYQYNFITSYTKISNMSTPELGDIFIEHNGDEGDVIYKITSKSSVDGQITFELTYVQYSTSDESIDKIKCGKLYLNDSATKVLTEKSQLFRENSKVNKPTYQIGKQYPIKLSANSKGAILIDYLKDHFGLKIVTTKGQKELASIKNGMISIRANEDGTRMSEGEIIKHSIHEFTHLALASFRMKDPDGYTSMITRFGKIIEPIYSQPKENEYYIRNFEEIDNDNIHYPTRIDKIEEKIIRYLTNTRSFASIDEQNFGKEELKNYINKGFGTLIGAGDLQLTDYDKLNSIEWLINRYGDEYFFDDVVENLDMLALKKNERFKKLLSKIEEYCF